VTSAQDNRSDSARRTAAATPAIRQLPLDRIRPGPHQARRHFSEYALNELADSIRESGLVQPIVVATAPDGSFFLLAGERRWRAAQRAGLDAVPAIVRDDLDEDEALVLGLVENLQRESLTPIETAEGLRLLGRRMRLTHERIGLRIGKSREYVSNMLRLLQLGPAVRTLVDTGALSTGHAKILSGIEPAAQLKWAEATIAGRWTVRRLEQALAAERKVSTEPAGDSVIEADRLRLQQRIADRLGCPVMLTSDSRGRGELRLSFHDWDELDGLLQRFGYRED